MPEVESIDLQHEIEWYMRPYLLDFLIEAHTAFQLLPSTLFLTVNLLDRYCSKRIVYKKHYQLVGCAALLIAAKYGDKKDRVPTIRELKSMCCGLYDDDMFIQMEWHVLQTLGWTVGHPTVDAFLQIAVMDTPYDPEAEHLALYILEISLFHRDFVSKTSANLARSALALSRCILGRPQTDSGDWASDFDSTTLVDLSQHLMRPSQVLYRKYSSHVYSRVSKLLEAFLAKQASMSRSSSYGSTLSSTHTKSGAHIRNVANTAGNGNMNASTGNGTIMLDAANAAKLGYVAGDMIGMVGAGLATPQKNGFTNVNVTNGYLTPPITPETSDAAVAAATAAAAGGNPNSIHVNSGAGTTIPETYNRSQDGLNMDLDVNMKNLSDAEYDAVMATLLVDGGSNGPAPATSSCSGPISPTPVHNDAQPIYQFTAGSNSSAHPSIANHPQHQRLRQTIQSSGHGHAHHVSLPVPIQPTVSFPEYNPFAGQAANMNFGHTHGHASMQNNGMHQSSMIDGQYVSRQRQHSSTMSALEYTGF